MAWLSAIQGESHPRGGAPSLWRIAAVASAMRARSSASGRVDCRSELVRPCAGHLVAAGAVRGQRGPARGRTSRSSAAPSRAVADRPGSRSAARRRRGCRSRARRGSARPGAALPRSPRRAPAPPPAPPRRRNARGSRPGRPPAARPPARSSAGGRARGDSRAGRGWGAWGTSLGRESAPAMLAGAAPKPHSAKPTIAVRSTASCPDVPAETPPAPSFPPPRGRAAPP